jgi:hypothetical protein
MKLKIDEFPKHLQKVVQEAVNKIDMQEIGDTLAQEIKLRTRLGYGLDTQGGTQSKLKPLSEPYKKARKKMKLSSETRPGKSNLTQTGEMLDSIKAEVNNGKITITFKNQFSKDKARWNTEKGRPFMAISKVQITKLKNRITDHVLKFIKENL